MFGVARSETGVRKTFEMILPLEQAVIAYQNYVASYPEDEKTERIQTIVRDFNSYLESLDAATKSQSGLLRDEIIKAAKLEKSKKFRAALLGIKIELDYEGTDLSDFLRACVGTPVPVTSNVLPFQKRSA